MEKNNGEKKRVHTVAIYLVDGMPKPSCDSVYIKKGEKVQWETAEPDTDFEITFDKPGLGFQMDRTNVKEGEPFTKPHPAVGKLGRYKYSIRELPDGPILDPTIDIGKP